jgi:hypothetical protein
MPFPFWINSTVTLPAMALSKLPEHLMLACVDQLEHEDAVVASDAPLTASFYVPIAMWVPTRKLTRTVDRGMIDIRPAPDGRVVLTYRFSVRRMVLISSVLAPVGFGLFTPLPWTGVVAMWLLLIVGNYFLALVSARFWFRRRIADAIEVAAQLAAHDASNSPS